MASPQPRLLVSSVQGDTVLTVQAFRIFISFSFFCIWQHPKQIPLEPKSQAANSRASRLTPQPETQLYKPLKTLPSTGPTWGTCSFLSSLLYLTEKLECSHTSQGGERGRSFLLNTWDFNEGNNMSFLACFPKQISKIGYCLISY